MGDALDSNAPAPATSPWTASAPAPAPAPDAGLHLDTKAWNLVDGNAADPNAGYFIGGVGQQGAKWGTAGGGFTGSVDQKGLDSTIKAGGDTIHATGDFGKQSGDVTVANGAGQQLADVYGTVKDGKNLDVGVKNTYNVDGTSLTPAVEHDVTNGAGSEVGKLDLSRGNLTGNASATAYDAGGFGAALGGNLKLDPNNNIGGTAGFTSQNGQDTLKLGTTDKQGDTTTTAGLDLGMGANKSATNTLTVANSNDSATFSQGSGANGSSVGLDLSHKSGSTTVGGGFSMGTDAKGNVNDSAKLSGSTALGDGTLAGNLAVTDKAGALAADASVGWSDKTDKLNLTAHDGGANDASLSAGYAHNADGTTVGINAGIADTKDGTKLTASESYGSKALAETGQISGTLGKDGNDSMTAGLSGVGQVTPNLYLGGYGNVGTGTNQPTNWNAGVDATYMVSPNVGISGAAGVGSNGVEGRISADLFSKKVDGADALASQQKNPALSVFLDASSGAGAGLNDQFGAGNASGSLGSLGAGGPQVAAGVEFHF